MVHFFLSSVFFLWIGAHEFYVSTTIVKIKEETKEIQITSKIFADDFEDLLDDTYNLKIEFKPSDNGKKVDSLVHVFFDKNLVISIDNKPQEIKFLGHQLKDDVLVLYAETHFDSIPKTFTLKNSFLLPYIPTQQNIVHVDFRGKKKSFLFTKRKTVQAIGL